MRVPINTGIEDVPGTWKIARLGDCAEIVAGHSPKGDTYNTIGAGVPLLNGPAEFGAAAPTAVQWTTNPTRITRRGDILFCVRGNTTGRLNIAEQEYCIGRGLAAIRQKEGRSTTEFVYYLLCLLRPNIYEVAVAGGSTFPNISKTILEDFEVPVPPLPEQRRIAHVLGTVQQAIEQQERLIRSTTELKQALMQKLFTEGLRGEAQKETEIGLVPESWVVVKLGSLSTVISKGSSPNWQGFQYQASGVLFVRSQNVGDGRMLLEDRVYLSEEFNQKEKRSILKQGDILINLVGASIGRVALGTSEVEGANCNQAVGFVRLKGAQAMKEFMVNFLLSPAGQEQMRQQKKDIARANLSLLDVRTFKVPMPSDAKELDEVARAFATIEGKLAHHATKHNALQDLFRTLLHELMTGKVRVGE